MAPCGSVLSRAENFIWLTARVLEQRRFAYDFLDGDPGAVETALDAYRNSDGGYGHALDPDLRGPVSQPLHTAAAVRILDSIGRCAGQRVERIGRYLTAVSTPEGALPAVHPSLRGCPAAPWFPVVDTPPGDLLATGPVVGALHRNNVWHAWLFRATDYCWSAVESLGKTHPYEVRAALAFLEGVPDRPRAEAAAERLGTLVREQRLVVTDPDRRADLPLPSGYAPGEYHYPTDFARAPRSPARRWFSDVELERALDHLVGRQRDDGGWDLDRHHWAPGTALEGRPRVTLEALHTLRAYGRL
ncbi:hypothetical protein [Streptomyces qinglanensis]|uniref:Prenyltransferase and squalene oxidase repeat-containing protein n=1 Tax=Streptomyces qinglanensis TaxID=943816 RepID=A0A1H9WQ60_9ACTN|nr:hypothetical protein [Streptomyces qinglanensis]SES36050.1 hypothetical protein SAMN05421870_119117 [Streptomyces qinglanensis]